MKILIVRPNSRLVPTLSSLTKIIKIKLRNKKTPEKLCHLRYIGYRTLSVLEIYVRKER